MVDRLTANLLNLLIAPVALLASPTQGLALSPKPDLKFYDFSRSHFTIMLPSRWKTRNDVIMPVVAAPPEVLNTNHEIPMIKVWINPAEKRITLKIFGDETKKQWASYWTVRSDVTKKVGENEQRIMIIDEDAHGKKRTMLKLFMIAKEHYYVVTCTSESKDFPKYQTLFERVVASFKPLI